jgi:HlyD family secretion protein
MKIKHLFLLLSSVLFVSCADKENDGILKYQVRKAGYSETLAVQGSVRAVVNVPVMPPGSGFGDMSVLKLAADGSIVKKGDTLCVLSTPEMENSYRTMLTTIETLEAGLKKIEAENAMNLAFQEAQLAGCESALRRSELDSQRMIYASEFQKKEHELVMRKLLIEKRKAEQKLASTKIIGKTNLAQAKARIVQEKSRAQSIADRLNSLVIIAQRDGMVLRTEAPIVMISSGSGGSGAMGGPIREGSVLFMQTAVLQFPDLNKMEITAEVLEADYRAIEKGQRVDIIVDAADRLVTTGKVNRKSIIGRNRLNYNYSQVKFYEVIIDVDSCHSDLKPGLNADCKIWLQDFQEVVTVPLTSLFEKNDTKVVYVANGRKYYPAEVETGYMGSSHSVILNGLSGGEVIALTEPPVNMIIKEKRTKNTKHRNTPEP